LKVFLFYFYKVKRDGSSSTPFALLLVETNRSNND
jgi:hypothetical protein